MLFSLAGEKQSEVSAAATTRHQQQLSQPAPTFNETFPISVMWLGLTCGYHLTVSALPRIYILRQICHLSAAGCPTSSLKTMNLQPFFFNVAAMTQSIKIRTRSSISMRASLKTFADSVQNWDILISTIPPWGKKRDTINYINDYLRNRGARNDPVRLLEAMPQAPMYFSKDVIHFNENGKQLCARNIAAFLSNFTRRKPNFNM